MKIAATYENGNIFQHFGQGTVAASGSVKNLRACDLPVLGVEYFKVFGMPKMLENISVFVGGSNFHSNKATLKKSFPSPNPILTSISFRSIIIDTP